MYTVYETKMSKRNMITIIWRRNAQEGNANAIQRKAKSKQSIGYFGFEYFICKIFRVGQPGYSLCTASKDNASFFAKVWCNTDC